MTSGGDARNPALSEGCTRPAKLRLPESTATGTTPASMAVSTSSSDRVRRSVLDLSVVPDVSAEHWQESPLVYAAFRARDYAPLVASRHGLRRITDLDGKEREFPLAAA